VPGPSGFGAGYGRTSFRAGRAGVARSARPLPPYAGTGSSSGSRGGLGASFGSRSSSGGPSGSSGGRSGGGSGTFALGAFVASERIPTGCPCPRSARSQPSHFVTPEGSRASPRGPHSASQGLVSAPARLDPSTERPFTPPGPARGGHERVVRAPQIAADAPGQAPQPPAARTSRSGGPGASERAVELEHDDGRLDTTRRPSSHPSGRAAPRAPGAGSGRLRPASSRT
jgi:hypothetical protein